MAGCCYTIPTRTTYHWSTQPDVIQLLNKWRILTALIATVPLIVLTIIIYWYGYKYYQLTAVIWIYGWSSHRLLLPLMNFCKPVIRENQPPPMHLYQIPRNEITLMDLLHAGRFQNPPQVDDWKGCGEECYNFGRKFFIIINYLWLMWGGVMAIWAWFRIMGYIFGRYTLVDEEWIWMLLFLTFLMDDINVVSFLAFIEGMKRQPIHGLPAPPGEIILQPIEEKKQVEIQIIENPKIAKHTYYTTCTICLESFKEGDDVKELNCKHIFHPKCIDAWTMNMNRNSCPTCNAKI